MPPNSITASDGARPGPLAYSVSPDARAWAAGGGYHVPEAGAGDQRRVIRTKRRPCHGEISASFDACIPPVGPTRNRGTAGVTQAVGGRLVDAVPVGRGQPRTSAGRGRSGMLAYMRLGWIGTRMTCSRGWKLPIITHRLYGVADRWHIALTLVTHQPLHAPTSSSNHMLRLAVRCDGTY